MAKFVKLRPKVDFQDLYLSFDTVYTVIEEGAAFTDQEDQYKIRFGKGKTDIGWFWASRFENVDERDLNVSQHAEIIKEETK